MCMCVNAYVRLRKCVHPILPYLSASLICTLLCMACLAGFMCPLSANRYGIEFLSFKIRDADSGRELFRVRASLLPLGTADVCSLEQGCEGHPSWGHTTTPSVFYYVVQGPFTCAWGFCAVLFSCWAVCDVLLCVVLVCADREESRGGNRAGDAVRGGAGGGTDGKIQLRTIISGPGEHRNMV